MLIRALIAWLVIVPLAILNGAFRESVLIPRQGGQMAGIVSTLLLSSLVLLVAWFLVPWIRPRTRADAWRVGVLWLALTLAFEFLAGHYLFGDSWERLLAQYDLAEGQTWILAVITTLVAPALAHALRRPRA